MSLLTFDWPILLNSYSYVYLFKKWFLGIRICFHKEKKKDMKNKLRINFFPLKFTYHDSIIIYKFSSLLFISPCSVSSCGQCQPSRGGRVDASSVKCGAVWKKAPLHRCLSIESPLLLACQGIVRPKRGY